MEFILYADSIQRDTTLYPSGNSYTLHLTNPLKNVTKIDLVAAIIPNTMYNYTSTSNAFQINTSNIFFNPGFYSTTSLVTAFNTSAQVASNVATLAYLSGEGKFIFYGTLTSLTCTDPDIARMFGLPIGTTNADSLATNAQYAGMFNGSNFIKSTSVVDINMTESVWLDISEFRTPLTLDARRLVARDSGQVTTEGNTAATSFALIPMDVNSGTFKSFKEESDYHVSVQFPSRIDSLERLTVTWRDRYGVPLIFNGLETNSFVIRVHTVIVPSEPERPESLPVPVGEGIFHDKQKVFAAVTMALVAGLIIIMLMARRIR